MKQKFTIIKNEEKKNLIIHEFAELDKDILSLLCEETYDAERIIDAISIGKEALIKVLRTKNMYPPSAYMNQIVEAVISLYEASGSASKDLMLNDMDLLRPAEAQPIPVIEEALEEDGDIDDLLDDDEVDDELDGKLELTKLKSSLKIADDEPEAVDED